MKTTLKLFPWSNCFSVLVNQIVAKRESEFWKINKQRRTTQPYYGIWWYYEFTLLFSLLFSKNRQEKRYYSNWKLTSWLNHFTRDLFHQTIHTGNLKCISPEIQPTGKLLSTADPYRWRVKLALFLPAFPKPWFLTRNQEYFQEQNCQIQTWKTSGEQYQRQNYFMASWHAWLKLKQLPKGSRKTALV